MIKVGFTGTQNGTTSYQRRQVRLLLRNLLVAEFHHGDCIGADAEAHLIAQKFEISIHIHPPKNNAKRAFCTIPMGGVELPPEEYLKRNRNIVDAIELLIACPSTADEKLRSGTWSTVRYAKNIGKPVIILDPWKSSSQP